MAEQLTGGWQITVRALNLGSWMALGVESGDLLKLSPKVCVCMRHVCAAPKTGRTLFLGLCSMRLAFCISKGDVLLWHLTSHISIMNKRRNFKRNRAPREASFLGQTPYLYCKEISWNSKILETPYTDGWGHSFRASSNRLLIPFLSLLPGKPALPPSDRLINVHLASPEKLLWRGFELD